MNELLNQQIIDSMHNISMHSKGAIMLVIGNDGNTYSLKTKDHERLDNLELLKVDAILDGAVKGFDDEYVKYY